MYFAGIDIGSDSTDVVVIDESKKIRTSVVLKTGASHERIAQEALRQACTNLNCNKNEIKNIVSTGYGRKGIEEITLNVTEISCHAKGAHEYDPECRTVIDIGGQDSKVIKLDKKGKVAEFSMNEKCAAGTGRFLSVMSRVLEVDLDKFGEYSLHSKESVKLSSLCAVFAESEVISKIAEGKKVEDIINGIHESICSRIWAMAQKLQVENRILMTGGVAQNKGLVRTLSNKLNMEIVVPDNPQVIGAYGAALYSLEKF